MASLVARVGAGLRRAASSVMANATMPFDRVYSGTPYRAAELFGQELGGWHPHIQSPDAEINLHRDRVVARARDLVRNDGWASGGIDRALDNVGSRFKLIADPDFLALQRECPACDAQWAHEFGGAIDAEWRLFADDPARACHAGRVRTMSQLLRLGMRHKLIDGEALGALLWLPDRVVGQRYATSLQLIDPDRLSNPNQTPDTRVMRNGVEIDGHGAPIAYHIRRAEQNDWYNAVESTQWDRIERETVWGRPIIVHDFDASRDGQSRGTSVLSPVVARFKMLTRYDGAELQQAVLQAVMRSFIQSPTDIDGLDLTSPDHEGALGFYQRERMEFARSRPAEFAGVALQRLFPGETIGSVPSSGTPTNFPDFEHTVLRSIAAAVGISAEQLSQDYSRANYSSIRASMIDMWKTLSRRRADYLTGFCDPIFIAWLEEALETTLRGLLPRGAPPFAAMRAAYARCTWIGSARGWIDPVKERQGAVLGLDAGFSTLKRECAEQGEDYRETIAQRVVEVNLFRSGGLKLPDWAAAENATQTDTKPQAA